MVWCGVVSEDVVACFTLIGAMLLCCAVSVQRGFALSCIFMVCCGVIAAIPVSHFATGLLLLFCFVFCFSCYNRCEAGMSECLAWEDVQRTCVKFSLSRTWRLGKAVLLARQNKTPPVETILEHEDGRLLVKGKV